MYLSQCLLLDTDNLSALRLEWWNKMFDFQKYQRRLQNFRFVSSQTPCVTLYIVQCTSSTFILRSPLLWSSHHCQCQTPQKRQWSRSPRKRTNLMIILKHNPTIHNLVAARSLWNLTILQETGYKVLRFLWKTLCRKSVKLGNFKRKQFWRKSSESGHRYCSSQPSMVHCIGWVALSFLVRLFVVCCPAMVTPN